MATHAQMGVPLALWSVPTVSEWVAEALADGLGGKQQAARYAASLREAEVDGELLGMLSDHDLEADVGIAAPLHRRKILAEVARLHSAGVGGGGGGGKSDDDDDDEAGLHSPPPVAERPRLQPRIACAEGAGPAAAAAAAAAAAGTANDEPSGWDPQSWLCCETDEGQLYFHNTAAGRSTYSAAHVPPDVLPPELRPADDAATAVGEDGGLAANSLILVSNRRYGRLSERMAAGRRPTAASELPPAPGQLREGEVPAWALAEPTPPVKPPLPPRGGERDGGGGATAAPIPTIQRPFEPLVLRATPSYSLPPNRPFVPRDKVDLSRHSAPPVANERTSIHAVPSVVEERYLHALKPALMSHLAAVAGPCPHSGTAEDMLRWLEGKEKGHGQGQGQPEEAANGVDGASSSSSSSSSARVDLLAELYDHLGPALHDAPWLDAVAPGPGGLTPDEEGMTGLPIPLRQALQSGLERSAGIGSGRLRSSGDADGGASHDHRESARQSKAEAQEVARAFIEEFENTAATLLSGAEKARLAKLRRARHAAALEIQRSSRGWLARQPDQPWAESYRLQTKAAMRIQSIYRGWAYRTLVWSAAVAAAPAPPTVGGGSSPAPAEQQQPQLTRRQRVEQKEEMENAQLQLQADRYNVRWEETFAQFVEKFGDSNKYKKFVLKDECHKRGLEDDGDSAALASRLSEYEADEAMSKESGVWEHERAVEQAKKNAYENASVKLKMKRLVEESGRDVERQGEERKAEAELLTREVSRVNKLLKAQARKHKQTVQQDPTAAAAAAAAAAAGGGGGGAGGSSSSSSSSAAQQGQQGQAQELTFEDLQRFKKTFELFKSLPANQLPPPPPVPLAGAGTGANEEEEEEEEEESGPSGSGSSSSSSSSTTMSGYRAGIAMRYLGSNPTEAELQELLRESGVAVAAAAAGTAAGTAAAAQRVDFSGFVTMMARKMTSTRKSEAELLAAFALFAAAATTTGTAAETGAAAGDGAGGTSPSSAQQEQRQEQQQVQRVISAAELRHILQNTGERMRPDEVDRILTIAIPPAAAAPAAATTAAAVDYAQLAKELLRG